MQKSWIRKLFALVLFVAGGALASHAQPYLEIFGGNGENKVYHFYIDESEGETSSIDITFWPNEGNVTEAELYSNLNRRDQATLYPADANSVTAGDTNGYWGAYALTPNGSGGYSITLPIEKTGSYDITARYKVSGDPNWRWYGGRNAVANVSDVETRDLVVYELQANVIDATGDTQETRSTFKDLHDGTRFNIDYLNNLGVNTIWLQPFHPIGATNDCNTGALGSPYSIKNLFQVAEHLGSDGTRETAMHEFTNFVQAAQSGGVKVIFDVIFNHVATDIEIERDPDNPSVLYSNPQAEMRDVKPQWFTKYIGSHPACQTSKPEWDWNNYLYTQPAENSSQIGPAPADRNDFVWPDAFDLFWGTYPALGNINNTEDSYWNASDEVKKMTEYYAYFIQYWIEQTGGAVGGFRCDFAQGIPRRAWQYLINKGKSIKPELYFVSESLDGGNIAYRAWKGGFDALNENQLWAIVEDTDIRTADLRGIIDQRKTDFGLALILRGTMNHDQGPWLGRKWDGAAMHSVFCAIDGTPQMYQGQELGYDALNQFSKERVEFGRTIPNIREYHNIQNLWNDSDPDKNALWDRYADANLGRSRSVALRLANQYYIDQVNGNGIHDYIFSVLKYENFGWDPADQEVVLAFVNLKPQQAQAGTFNVDVPAIYLNPSKTYNVRNLASTNWSQYLWPEGRSGSDIAANGIYVGFSGNIYDQGSVAQYLKLEEVGGSGGDSNITELVNARHWPTNGALTSLDDLWIDIESGPIGAGDFGSVVYSSDGVNWNTKALEENGTAGAYDAWHVNLGKFPANSQVRYSIEVVDRAGTSHWANNNGSNYLAIVSQGGSGTALEFVGNTRHYPTNGAIESSSDLWIDVESWPVGAGAGGEVVYSADGGTTWNIVLLEYNGTTSGENTNDWWHVNLGQFASGTTIKYAVNVSDGLDNTIWDNNGGNDYTATVNGQGDNSDIIWVGNARHAAAAQPDLGDVKMMNGPRLDLDDLKNGATYGVYKASDLGSWQMVDSFVGDGSTYQWTDPDGTNDVAFYTISGQSFPFGTSVFGGDQVIIQAESYPTGKAAAATIIYTTTGNNWLSKPMEKVGENGNNDLWEVNIGSFPLGVQLQYAIEFQDANTKAMWANNSSANYMIGIKDPNAPDDEAPVLSYSPSNTTTAAATLDVTLSATDNEDPDPMIFYTTNGSTPTTNSSIYNLAIQVTDQGAGIDMTIKAIAVDITGNASPVTTIDVKVNETFSFGGTTPYSTNPTLGQRVANGGITIDGSASDWSTNHLIALDMANDDPRSLDSNWTMHEAPIDLTHLWAAWDDDNLYIAWQYVDVTDKLDPANAGGAASGKISSNDGILQWIVIDTVNGAGATNDVWSKQNTWAGSDKPDYQVYLAGSLWQGYISRAVNGTFALDDGGVNYMAIAAAGVTAAKGSLFGAGALWGVSDADNRYNGGEPSRNFLSESHDTSRDSFYEIKIPLSFLQITAAQLESNGIGIMIGGGSDSSMDSIPHDETTLDTPGVEVYNSSFEWSDADVFTSPFARVGAGK